VTAVLRSSAPHLRSPASFAGPLKDWGYQPDPIAGHSKSDGILLHKGPDGRPEVGLWQCTPGTWPLAIPRDELCHFVSGRAVYVHESGERIEVNPATVVLFRAGWRGTCTVLETMRNVYMLV
jgi:uncharacterized cupin superfamily protein